MEAEFIAWLRRRLGRDPRLPLGVRDDAALWQFSGAACVATTDLISDDVDFRLAEDDPRRVGRKALAVNLSDMAAMAARPAVALVSLLLPRSGGLPLAKELMEGMLPLAEQFDVAIGGGDFNVWDHPLAISVTVLGEPGPHGVLRRNGAQPGDWILVTGELGGSLLGRHFEFEPRVAEAWELQHNYDLHAGMDISDGLALDLSRMCEASDCGAEIELSRLPISDAARTLSERDGRSPEDHALGDGEDFELLLAVPPELASYLISRQILGTRLTNIGRFVADRGLWKIDSQGLRTPLPPSGWLHA